MNDDNTKKSNMVRFAPTLGLICGGVAGNIIGLLINQNIALFAVIGSGVGLVIGSIVYTNIVNQPKETDGIKPSEIIEEIKEDEQNKKDEQNEISEVNEIIDEIKEVEA